MLECRWGWFICLISGESFPGQVFLVKSRVYPFALACHPVMYEYIRSRLYDVLITNVCINDQRL